MKLTSVALQNLWVAGLQGVVGIVPTLALEGNDSPSQLADTLRATIRSTLPTQKGSVWILFDEWPDDLLYGVLYSLKVREPLPNVLVNAALITEEIGRAGQYADLLVIRCTDRTWKGVMGHALLMQLTTFGADPTDGYPLSLYPQGYWLEQGEGIKPEQMIQFTQKYPKWRLSIPPRTIYRVKLL